MAKSMAPVMEKSERSMPRLTFQNMMFPGQNYHTGENIFIFMVIRGYFYILKMEKYGILLIWVPIKL